MLTLAAQDAEDLEVVSARLQDAVTRVGDLVWLPGARRFLALFNRFKWEDAESKGEALRVRAGLCIENVLSAKAQKIRMDDPAAILSLLAMRFAPDAPREPGGLIELIFSGGGTIRLAVECVEASLADVSGEWAARGLPAHSFDS